jgi:dethiobiotin synthetase
LNKKLLTLLSTLDLSKGLFITGTDTDVGKTWVGCQIIEALQRQGHDVAPRKPVESGWHKNITQTDAWKLATAANKQQQLEIICPNRFTAPISPARAAVLEKRERSILQLKQQCLETLDSTQILYVEGAGGFYSPLCKDGLNADLCAALNLAIIIVAEDKLGCINHVLLTVEAIKQRDLTLACIILNQRQTQHAKTQQDNWHDLKTYLPHDIIIHLNKRSE